MQDHGNHKRLTSWVTPENHKALYDECRRRSRTEGAAVHVSRIVNELIAAGLRTAKAPEPERTSATGKKPSPLERTA